MSEKCNDVSVADVDECESKPCHEHGMCTNLQGSFNCTCKKGYVGDGTKDARAWLYEELCFSSC